jgi:hypothetical protein
LPFEDRVAQMSRLMRRGACATRCRSGKTVLCSDHMASNDLPNVKLVGQPPPVPANLCAQSQRTARAE